MLIVDNFGILAQENENYSNLHRPGFERVSTAHNFTTLPTLSLELYIGMVLCKHKAAKSKLSWVRGNNSYF